ncbi:MAG: MCE family protein [Marmoricola sp.]
MSALTKTTKGLRLGPRAWTVLAVVVVAILGLLYFSSGDGKKTVTVYFDQAISIYPATDVDIMGVPVGSVDSVTPEGSQVKVTISYDSKYQLPSNVRAAVITPTLVADRFIQLSPAYSGGPVLPSGAVVPLYYANGQRRNAVPIELDQIYSSLADLTKTLGPNGANKNGALSELLHQSALALKGNGQLGNATIANLSKAMQVLGDNSSQIFGTVDNLASLTTTLQANDKFVGQFMTHLATVSSQLAGESGDLQQALAAVANAVGTVQAFVHDNRAMLKADIKQLTTTVGVLAKQKDTLGQVLQYSALGLGNLTDAYDNSTGTIGIRAQLGPMGSDLGNVLCNTIAVSNPTLAQQACPLLKALLGGGTSFGAGLPTGGTNASAKPPAKNGIQALLSGLGVTK